MALTARARLGPYEIVAPLGAGGMGEVYRARDTRLDRSVAIKILPEHVAANASLRQRFEREARAISQLNHPNICTLYDVGSDESTQYLVMEYIDGQSLADRLERGALPLDEVLRIGIDIASALDRAHRAGIVHRDLKPGNIMLTRGGAKLLDFGLARYAADEPAGDLTTDLTQHKPLTAEGTILGTFQYMAPEQLEGRPADARTDLFALGAVLFEMATGRRAFDGKTRASLIAAILEREPPPMSELQPMTPPAFDRLVRACLAKDPDERWQSGHDVLLQLRTIAEGSGAATVPAPGRPRRSAAIAAGVLALATAVLATLLWREVRRETSVAPVRTALLPPHGGAFTFLTGSVPALSPDGDRVAFLATVGGQSMIYVRSLDSPNARPIPGTEAATFPFWSPDGVHLGFFSSGKLKTTRWDGGAPIVLCDARAPRGASWGDGVIIFGSRVGGITRVADVGGTPVPLTTPAADEASHRWPLFLPDGKNFLYLASPTGGDDPRNAIYTGSLSGAKPKRLVSASSQPLYLDGHLLFVRDQVLMAQRIDLRRRELNGEALPLPEQQIEFDALYARATIDVSPDGTAVYRTGRDTYQAKLAWYDRSGAVLGYVGDVQPYFMFSLSPDEKSLAYNTRDTRSNVWLLDLERGVRRRLTFGQSMDASPVFSPDGRRVAYSAGITGNRAAIMVRDLSTGSETKLLDVPFLTLLSAWSEDGRTLWYYREGGGRGENDTGYYSFDDAKSHDFAATEYSEMLAVPSPDGKWIAYQTNETGRWEVYLAPFPATGAKWPVSPGGGARPQWRADGRELFYTALAPDQKMMAVPITLQNPPLIGQAATLFQFQSSTIPPPMAISRDGRRFLISVPATNEEPPPLTLVQNLDAVLRAAARQRK